MTWSYAAASSHLAIGMAADNRVLVVRLPDAASLSITDHTPDPSHPGEPVEVSFELSPATPTVFTPTGAVTVTDGTAVCTAVLPADFCRLTFASSGVRILSAAYSGDAFTLIVRGTNFVAGSAVRWNVTDRPTTFVSAAELQANIEAEDLLDDGQVAVTVFNPPPGGGESAALIFAVELRKLHLPALLR